MAKPPRDINSYITALTETAAGINPNLDVRKGPVAVIMYATAVVGAQTEVHASYLQSLYNLNDIESIDDDDVFNLGENFGIDPNRGVPARGLVYFYTTVPPDAGEAKHVEVGYIISTSDSRYNFLVTESAEMAAEAADAYYNSTEKRYELPVSVQAEAVGDDFNLPPGTLNTIQTTQADWEGVVNKDYMRQGRDPLDKVQFRNLIWNAQQGLNQSSSGNILNALADMNPAAFDAISLVSSADLDVFKRLNTMNKKMGYDIYIITDNTREDVMSGVAKGGEYGIILEKQPVMSVVYVLVDGVKIPFSLQKDDRDPWRDSAKAADTVVFTTPLQPAQVYQIRYLYYDLIKDGQTYIENGEGIFGTDTLVRLADRIEIYIEGTAYAVSTANTDDIVAEIEAFTVGYLRDPGDPSVSEQSFTSALFPYDYQQAVEANVDGITHFRLTKFVRTDNAQMDTEVITLDGMTQYPVLSINSIFEVR